MPLGGNRSAPVNFALICATHRHLAQRVAEGAFREDLLYRLREYALPSRRYANGLNSSSLFQRCGARLARQNAI